MEAHDKFMGNNDLLPCGINVDYGANARMREHFLLPLPQITLNVTDPAIV